MDSVLAVTFNEDSKAYEALSSLKELDDQGQVDLTGAAVVLRSEDGRLETKDHVGDTELEGTAVGGTVGLIIGILGGPLGVLLGGATGLLIGSLFDMDDADETESALSDISRSVRPGHPALLAQVSEQTPDVVDAAEWGVTLVGAARLIGVRSPRLRKAAQRSRDGQRVGGDLQRGQQGL